MLSKENVNAKGYVIIIDEDKLNNCYESNGKIYPLCKGGKNSKKCKDCNVYER